ncbi:MAG: hypothetical protein ACFFA5_10040 [Promethearchaeota archaeon]
MVRRDADSKEKYKQAIVLRLMDHKKQLFSELNRSFSKGRFKMTKKTLSKYLKELITEQRVEKVGAFYTYTKSGEECWGRSLISQRLEELNRTDLDHMFNFQKFLLENKGKIDAAHFSELLPLFEDLVEHEDLFIYIRYFFDILVDLKEKITSQVDKELAFNLYYYSSRLMFVYINAMKEGIEKALRKEKITRD